MRKISLFLAVITLLAAGSTIQAQKELSYAPITQYPSITVQDDRTSNFAVINPNTGEYKIVLCQNNGQVVYGKAAVKINGCLTDITDVREGYQVVVSVNTCDQVAKAVIEITEANQPRVSESWFDANVRDNVAECKALPPPPPPIDPTPVAGMINIQSDADGSYLLFDSNTGEYKFIRCSDGVALSGVGRVKIDGCSVTFEDLQATYRVVASVNICDQQGKAAIEVFAPTKTASGEVMPMQEYVSDNNLRDNTTECGAKVVTK
jgi:hypothetical protein